MEPRPTPSLKESLLLLLQRPILFWLPSTPKYLPLQLQVMDLLVKYQILPEQNMTELLYLRAEGYLKLNQSERALHALNDLLEHPIARHSDYQAWAYLHRGHLYQKQQGDYRLAVSDLLSARHFMRPDNTTLVQRYTICLDLAWCQVRTGDYAEAVDNLTQLIEQGMPAEVEAVLGKRPESLYALRAFAHYQLRDYRQAMADLDRSEGVRGGFMPEIDSMDTAEMLYAFAGIRVQAEDIQGAFTDLAMAVQLQPALRQQAREDQVMAPLRTLPEAQAFLAADSQNQP